MDMRAMSALPSPGTSVRCISNQDRPELIVGQVYIVAPEQFLDKCPINYARYQPEDFRFIAVKMPGKKENGIFPFGVFEVVKT